MSVEEIKKALADAALPAAEPVAWLPARRWEQITAAEPWLTNIVYSEDQAKFFPCIPLYAAPPAPSVAVKALEWQKVALGTLDWNWLEVETANTAFGAYSLQRHNTGHLRVMFGGKVVNFFEPDKHTDARAAAQADYEARIRSSLSAQVQVVATAAEFADRMFKLHGFMLCERHNGKHAVTVTFPNLSEAQQFHGALVDLSRHTTAAAPAKQEGSHVTSK